MTTTSEEVRLTLAPGSLGVGIYRQETDGTCVVSQKNNAASPLQVGDVIVRLNGVTLADIKDGVKGWVALFQASASRQRNVVVRRAVNPSPTAAVAAAATNNYSSAGAPTNNGSTKNKVTATVFKPTKGSKLGIGLVGTGGVVKIISLAKDGLFASTPLQVGMTVDTINNIKCTDAGNCITVLKEAERQVTVVAVHNEKTKKALKPSTYQNAKKRKAVDSKPKRTYNKKPAVSKQPAKYQKVATPKPSKNPKPSKSDFEHDEAYMHLLENGFPEPGCVSPCQNYYVTKNNDTYISIAKMLGMEDWKQLATLPFNQRFYGKNSRTKSVLFQRNTVVQIPKTAASKWKMNKIIDNSHEEIKAMATCSKCLKKELPNDPDEMLICDGCDNEMHVSCAGLTSVPAGDWLCDVCLEILDARKKHHNATETRSLEAKLPPLTPLDSNSLALAAHAEQRFISHITARKTKAIKELEENQRVLAMESEQRIERLKRDIVLATMEEAVKTDAYVREARAIMNRLKLVEWHINSVGWSTIRYKNDDGSVARLQRRRNPSTLLTTYGLVRESYSYEGGTQNQWQTWHNKVLQYTRESRALPQTVARNAAKERLASLEEELSSSESNERDRPSMDEDDRRSVMLNFATLLSEPQLGFESLKEYRSREGKGPLFLGIVKTRELVHREHNFYALNCLRSLLSRIVIRHSKEQDLGGKALVSLPPRTVETLHLSFGSKEEKIVYDYLETQQTARFMSLRGESPNTVLGKFIELNGMLFTSRHACGHVSLVNLDNVHNLNAKIEREREEKNRKANKGKKPEPKKLDLTRADILQQAITAARPSASNRMRAAVMSIQEGEIEYLECPICLDPIEEKDIALTPCAHKFCGECIRSCLESLSSSREPRGNCPECRDLIKLSELTFLGDANDIGEKKLTSNDEDQKPQAGEKSEEVIDVNGFNLLTKDIFSDTTGASDHRVVADTLTQAEKKQQRAFCHTIPGEVLEAWNVASAQVGTKVARLLEEIRSMTRNDVTSKCVVFSQYLGTLDITGQELMARGVKYARVDGNMKQYQRADAIHSFTNDPDVCVLLLSMRAGAAGLNLMAANYCFLLDPATNSAIEEQAIDRIHRIGQTRPVTVKRFIMKDSVEERVLQNRRALAADRPNTSFLLDGSGDLEEEEKLVDRNQTQTRERHADENGMGEKSFQRLRHLEALFGCEATVKVTKG